jgi:hypothetical protein
VKPIDQWTPEELVANLEAAVKEANVRDLIGALVAVQMFEGDLEEVSRRQLISLLAARLAVRTLNPKYAEGGPDA